MPPKYTGTGSYIYCKSEGTTFGWAAAAIGATGHIPVNPLVMLTNLPEPRYRERTLRTIDTDKAKIIFTELMERGEATMDFIFKDPFFMAFAFHHKVVDTPWTGTDDDITMDFTDTDDRESFMIHIHLEDQSGSGNHVDMTFYGCRIEAYKWRVEPGRLMHEIVRVSCINAKEDVQAMVCVDGFHDVAWGTGVGGWADWDPDAPYHASEITPKIGGAALTTITLLWFEIGLEYPKKERHTTDSMIASLEWDDIPLYFFEVHGTMETDADLVEIKKTFANKTTNQTLKVEVGSTTNYMQFTNGYLKDVDKVKITEATVPYEHKIRYEGGVASALSVALKYSIATDPDPMITD